MRSGLLKMDRRIEVICTRQESDKLDRRGGKTWYKSKNSLSESNSKNAGRQLVGICTVDISSVDSSAEVPIKSKLRQFLARLSK